MPGVLDYAALEDGQALKAMCSVELLFAFLSLHVHHQRNYSVCLLSGHVSFYTVFFSRTIYYLWVFAQMVS